MNINKLIETQKELRAKINYQGGDRFEKLVLALLVEIGECANEWRGFKFWSKKQHPRHIAITNEGKVIKNNFGTPPLLEEFVDGLCFILELGIEIGIDNFTPSKLISFSDDVTGNFRSIYRLASSLDYMMLLLNDGDYRTLFNNYLHLGESLGFSWEEIEKAYYEKNQINHDRQDSGVY